MTKLSRREFIKLLGASAIASRLTIDGRYDAVGDDKPREHTDNILDLPLLFYPEFYARFDGAYKKIGDVWEFSHRKGESRLFSSIPPTSEEPNAIVVLHHSNDRLNALIFEMTAERKFLIIGNEYEIQLNRYIGAITTESRYYGAILDEIHICGTSPFIYSERGTFL